MSPSPDILSSYRGWLYSMARNYSSDIGQHDDIAQEGAIAMWKALDTFDSSRGSLPTWLTGAARMRMSEVVRRRNWTGTPMTRGHTRERPAIPADPDKLRAASVFLPDSADLAPHRAEIRAAVACLPLGARTALYKRFWLDESADSNMWKRHYPELTRKLSTLQTAI